MIQPLHLDMDNIPAATGAYALIIELSRELAFDMRGGDVALAPGAYLYCGSAYGPGGIAARVGRHARRQKKRHWHVDHLTAAGRLAAIYAFPGGSECALVAGALALDGVGVPIRGLGASDCRNCAAHLLSLPENSVSAGGPRLFADSPGSWHCAP